MKHLGWSCVLLALSACPSKLNGPCGGFTCTETERCESDTATCVPDEPPVISAIVPATVVNTPTFALSGIITDDEAVTQAEWQTGSAGPFPLTLGEEGGFTIMVDAPMLDSQSTVITLRARDARSQTTRDVSVQVDRVPPVLSLIRPDAGTLIGAAAVEVAVAATDGSETIAALSVGGQAVSMPRSGVEAVQMLQVPSTLNGDPLDFVVTEADPYGNQATQTFSLVGDRVAPAVIYGMPGANAVISTASFMVEVNVSDPSPIASVTVLFGGNSYVATEASAGRWTADVLTSVEEQDQMISVTAIDAAGNSATQALPVRVDRVAPTLSVVSPTAGSLQSRDLSVTVTTSAGTASVSAVLEGALVMLSGGPTLWTGTVAFPQDEIDYVNSTLTVTATDMAGNAASADVMLILDNEPPELAFTSPMQDQRFKASDFTTSTDVVVTWTLADGDPQATITTVNGVASTALTTRIPTGANDNPATYSTTVVATDRAGNIATFTTYWTVDRVAPTVVSWTPANNARNVEPWESVITFSEPVSDGPSMNSALLIAGQPRPQNGSWNATRTAFTLPLDTFKNRVLDVSLASTLADDNGNPVVAAPRRFHFATGFPTGTTTVATGVSHFDVSADNDGVMTIVAIKAGGFLSVYQDTGGAFAELGIAQTSSFTDVSINSANVVSGTTLQSSRRVGITANVPTLPSPWWRYQYLDGVATGMPTGSVSPASVVSRPPLANEPSTATFAMIDGSTYTRGSVIRSLSNTAKMVVAQSNDSIAAFDTSSTQVLWSHYRCRALITGGHNCGSIGYGASATNPTALKAAMTPNGSCLATTWTSNSARQAVFQPLSPCDLTSCFGDTNLGLLPPALTPTDLRVAPFGANGENTFLFSYASSPIELSVAKMTDSCGPGRTTPLGTFPLPSAHQPVRVGNHAGVVFLTGNTLQLRVF